MNSVYIKTKIFTGTDSLKRLENFKDRNIWIVCDSFLVKSGSLEMVLGYIDKSNKISIFDKVVPEPPVEVIGKGLSIIKKVNPDIVIGFGGGSAIDTAKGILYFARQANMVSKVLFIAIPTTSGTGSEVTSATVITDTEKSVKNAIFDDSLIPDEAILDANLTISVPKSITANTGLDVLTHALEAYVSKNANVYSDALAEKSVELVIKSLLKTYINGNDIDARKTMHEASNLAGIAFNIAGLGINHSLAHQIGSQFHVPHGLANAILLTTVIDYNSEDKKCAEKYAKLTYKCGMVDNNSDFTFAIDVLKKYIETIMSLMNMKTSLKEFKVSLEEFNKVKTIMAENAMKDNCTPNNPRKSNINDLERLLENIY